MANKMRWRYGDTNPVLVPVAEFVAIEIGDLVMLTSGNAEPASDLADTGTEAGNQEAFHDLFIGVAMQQSRSGDTAPIRVATTGVFEFDCASATIALGAFVGADEDGTGSMLQPQVVAAVATANLAIGRVEKAIAAATSVLVRIVSTVNLGGPQTMM
jgi:hypothetical protein